MAEREGFEPSVPLLVVHAISSRAPSASSDISPRWISDSQTIKNLLFWDGSIDKIALCVNNDPDPCKTSPT